MQTTVADSYQNGTPGLLAECSLVKRTSSRVNAEASAEIPFGVMAARGASATEAKLLAATTDGLAGVVLLDHAYHKDEEVGDTGIKPGTELTLLTAGAAFVALSGAITDITDEVHLRVVEGDAGELAGSFAAALTTNDQVIADTAFTAAASDVCTAAAHGFQTGDGPVQATTDDTLPAGLALATDYFIIRLDPNTFSLATTRANALAGIAVDITDAGTGNHTLSDTATTARVTSLNLSSFARWLGTGSDGEAAALEFDLRNAALASLG